MHKAVFFDRDGTLIEPVHYLNKPDQVRLIPDVADVLQAVAELGYLRIVVTNQAAIAKGLLTVEGLQEIQAEFARQLHELGSGIDDWYYCPRAGNSADRERIEHHDRKPGPGMLLRAAHEHDIDLSRSVMVGDTVSDTLAGRTADCAATVLVGDRREVLEIAGHDSVDVHSPVLGSLPDILRDLEAQWSKE